MALLITQTSILYVSLLFCRNYITIVLRLMGIYFQEGERNDGYTNYY